MAAGLRTIRIDHSGTTNAHDASMVRCGASMIQGGSTMSSYNCVQFNGCYICGLSIGQPYCIHGDLLDLWCQ